LRAGWRLAGLGVAAWMASGCLGFLPDSTPPQYYVLSAMRAPDSRARPVGDLSLGVGPVQIPGYLDRPQIGTRTGRNELSFSETERWGEPLQQNVTLVLAQNLAQLLRTDRISLFPFPSGRPRDYDVVLTLLRFECGRAGQGAVDAYWQIRRPGEVAPLVTRPSEIVPACGQGSAADQVSALSAALEEISRQVATELRRQPTAAGPRSGPAARAPAA